MAGFSLLRSAENLLSLVSIKSTSTLHKANVEITKKRLRGVIFFQVVYFSLIPFNLLVSLGDSTVSYMEGSVARSCHSLLWYRGPPVKEKLELWCFYQKAIKLFSSETKIQVIFLSGLFLHPSTLSIFLPYDQCVMFDQKLRYNECSKLYSKLCLEPVNAVKGWILHGQLMIFTKI